MKRNFAGQFRLSAIPDDRYSLCISADRRTFSPFDIRRSIFPKFSTPFGGRESLETPGIRTTRPFNRIVSPHSLFFFIFDREKARSREVRIKRKNFTFLFVNYLDPFLCRLDRWFKVSNFRSIPLFLIYLIRLIRLIDIFIFYATVFNNSFASWYIRRSESSGWMC